MTGTLLITRSCRSCTASTVGELTNGGVNSGGCDSRDHHPQALSVYRRLRQLAPGLSLGLLSVCVMRGELKGMVWHGVSLG